MTKLVPGANDFAMLQPLQWNTRYEAEITARNVKGLSEPTFYQFFMPQEPDITGTGKHSNRLIYLFRVFGPRVLDRPVSPTLRPSFDMISSLPSVCTSTPGCRSHLFK